MSDMNFRHPFEAAWPNRKQVAYYIRTAKTAAERKVWRDMLNGASFTKPKTNTESKTEKKVAKDVKDNKGGKKK